MSSPTEVGNKSEGMAMAKFIALGWVVLIPFGNNERYDLLINRGNGFERVQVKTARLEKKTGVITFNTASTSHGREKNYRGQCDLFAAVCPELNTIYLLSVNDVGISKCRLRTRSANRPNQHQMRYAEDYKI